MSGLDMETELLEDEDEDEEESERTKKIKEYTEKRDKNQELFVQTREVTFECIAKVYQQMIDNYDCQVTSDEVDTVKVEGTATYADHSKYENEITAAEST